MRAPAGAGHFVKMVHNGIEYGLMQALCRRIRHHARPQFSDKLPEDERFRHQPVSDVAEVWRRGSVVASWLLDLTAIALAKSGTPGRTSAARWMTAAKAAGRWRRRWTRRWRRR